MRFGFEIAAAIVVAGMSVPAAEAHEFWIDGTVVERDGATLLALDLKVGQMLDGISLPYIPEMVESFEWVHGGRGAISGAVGESPVAHVPIDPSEGAVIFHRTAPRRLVHHDWTTFLEYLAMEGLDGIAAAHDRRGLPRTGFAETYTRHAKFALVDPAGQVVKDRYLGSPLEIVLERVSADGGALQIAGQVVGADDAGTRQVSVFRVSREGPVVQRIATDAEGRFAIALAGDGPVLMNAVKISPVPGETASWHSDWASMFLDWR